ncbi:MAG: nitroreductase family protein [Tumebacillaceae bacterium]
MSEMTRDMSREVAIPLYDAVEHRHSLRSYTGEKLPADQKAKLSAFLENGWEPYAGIHTRAVLLEGVKTTGKIFKGVIGSYGSVQNAPAMVAFIAPIDEPYFYEAVGYMGEQVVLYATYLGLDTCWIGGFFRPEVAHKLAGCAENERVVAVAPVGFGKRDGMSSIYEGLFKFGTNRGKRKTIAEISHVEEGEPPRWFQRGLEAVQVAPSSYNKQPWMIMYHREGRISMNSILEYKEKHPLFPGAPNSSRLCCGIAMLHFKVTARALGINGVWMPEEERSNPMASFIAPELVQDELNSL